VKVAKEMALQPVDGFIIEGLDVSLDRGEAADLDAIIPLINETVVRISYWARLLFLHANFCRKFFLRKKCAFFQGAGAQRHCGLWCRQELMCLTRRFQQ
jgi:hypothetical protein